MLLIETLAARRLTQLLRSPTNISVSISRHRTTSQPAAPAPAFTYFDIALFVVFFLLICLLSGVVIYKIRSRRHRVRQTETNV